MSDDTTQPVTVFEVLGHSYYAETEGIFSTREKAIEYLELYHSRPVMAANNALGYDRRLDPDKFIQESVIDPPFDPDPAL